MTELVELSRGDLSLTIDPKTAARLVQIRWQGVRLLSGPDLHPTNWGATMWTSPQADWGWPPIEAIDSAPYEVLEASPDEVRLQGPPADLEQGRVRIEKRVRLTSRGFDVDYGLHNVGETAVQMAVWEISRVPAGGLTYFPTGEQELTPIAPHQALVLERESGVSFYDHGRFVVGPSRKVHADGREGWLAHKAADVLMLKCFLDSPAARQAPGEGEVEIFANEDGKYVEVEVQGPYERIEAQETSWFRVRTLVTRVAGAVSRQELVAQARELRKREGTLEHG